MSNRLPVYLLLKCLLSLSCSGQNKPTDNHTAAKAAEITGFSTYN